MILDLLQRLVGTTAANSITLPTKRFRMSKLNVLGTRLVLKRTNMTLTVSIMNRTRLSNIRNQGRIRLNRNSVNRTISTQNMINSKTIRPTTTAATANNRTMLVTLLNRHIANLKLVKGLNKRKTQASTNSVNLRSTRRTISILRTRTKTNSNTTNNTIKEHRMQVNTIVSIRRHHLNTLGRRILTLVSRIIRRRTHLNSMKARTLNRKRMLITGLIRNMNKRIMSRLRLKIRTNRDNLRLITRRYLIRRILRTRTSTNRLILVTQASATLNNASILLTRLLLGNTVRVSIMQRSSVHITTGLRILNNSTINLRRISLLGSGLKISSTTIASRQRIIKVRSTKKRLIRTMLLTISSSNIANIITTQMTRSNVRITNSRITGLALTLVTPLNASRGN